MQRPLSALIGFIFYVAKAIKGCLFCNKIVDIFMVSQGMKQPVSQMGKDFESAYQEAQKILVNAKNRAWQAINAEMVPAYWNVGRILVEQEQKLNAVRSELSRSSAIKVFSLSQINRQGTPPYGLYILR